MSATPVLPQCLNTGETWLTQDIVIHFGFEEQYMEMGRRCSIDDSYFKKAGKGPPWKAPPSADRTFLAQAGAALSQSNRDCTALSQSNRDCTALSQSNRDCAALSQSNRDCVGWWCCANHLHPCSVQWLLLGGASPSAVLHTRCVVCGEWSCRHHVCIIQDA
jgi:hypothetical protein